MAKFCIKCGRPLREGEICECRRKEYEAAAGNRSGGGGYAGALLKNITGFADPTDKGGNDWFERGKKIVPDCNAPCEKEIPIKQYHIADFRSRIRFLWAEGRMMITNKRIIFRAAGRSIVGRTVLQDEYCIDDISGLEISRGVRFSAWDFVLSLLFVLPITAGIFLFIAGKVAVLGWILAIAGLAPYVLVKKWYLKFLGAASSFGCVAGLVGASIGNFGRMNAAGPIFLLILLAATVFALVLGCFKLSVSINFLCKSGGLSPISMKSEQHFALQNAKELLPAEDTDLAIKEIGALITDIQKLGDYGISKWQR